MYVIYKYVGDFTDMVLIILSRTFFDVFINIEIIKVSNLWRKKLMFVKFQNEY